MSNIYQHNFNNCKLRLSNSDYWDHFISYDCEGSGINHAAILSGDCLLINIDINDDNSYSGDTLYNLVDWTGSTVYSSGVTLNDIGLTGIDNGFINYECSGATSGETFLSAFTGSTLFLSSGDTRFFMTRVSGCTYDYTITPLTGTTEGRYSRLCGGFYQGFFKLSDKTFFKEISDNKFVWPLSWFTCEPTCTGSTSGTTSGSTTGCTSCNTGPNKSYQCYLDKKPIDWDYQTLPKRYDKGWTSEFWLKKTDNGCSGNTATTLNDIYSGNTGFFYYMGTRAENKFWDVFSGETGYTTSSGFPLEPPAVTATTLSGNPFLVYNGSNLTSGCTFPGVITTITRGRNRDADIVQNALGFRIKDDGSIGYRYLTVSGECSGDTYVTGTSIEESYSDSGVVYEDNWVQVVVRFTAYNTLIGCDLINGSRRKGRLDFLINGYLKYSIEDFDEFLFKDLNEHREKQEGVPFNYSFGGGTQGLIETNTVNGPDVKDEDLVIQENFAGTFKGCASIFKMWGCSLDTTTIRYRFEELKVRFGLSAGGTVPSTPGFYWGKLNQTTISLGDETSLTFTETTKVTESYVTLDPIEGYGFFLIPTNFDQPTDFRNSDDGCDNFNVPYTTLGTITIDDSNGFPITYYVYRTTNKTFSPIDVWMCG